MAGLPPLEPALEISIASSGMSKGIAQTDGIQFVGRFELAIGPVTVGALGKNVTSDSANGEAQIWVGGNFRLLNADWSGSIMYKKSISPIGSVDDQSVELALGASRRLGTLMPRVQFVYSPDDLGPAGQSAYAELGVSWALARHTAFVASFGHRMRENAPDYVFANAGLSYALDRSFTAEARAYWTNRSGEGNAYDPRIVATIRGRL